MNLIDKTLILILPITFAMVTPALANSFAATTPETVSSECKVYSVEDWKESKECPKIARMYVTGDKDDAIRLAKELLPSVENIYKKRHNAKDPDTATYDFGAELSMLQAVIKDDEQQVKTYMENDYDSEEDDLYGFTVGLDGALAIYKKSMELIGAEPLSGKSSPHYLYEGQAVVALLYATGQKDQAKALAKELLPLAQHEKAEEGKDSSSPPVIREDVEAFFRGILNDDKDVVVYHSPKKKMVS